MLRKHIRKKVYLQLSATQKNVPPPSALPLNLPYSEVSTGKKTNAVRTAGKMQCISIRDVVRHYAFLFRDEEKRERGKSKRSAQVHERVVLDHNLCSTVLF